MRRLLVCLAVLATACVASNSAPSKPGSLGAEPATSSLGAGSTIAVTSTTVAAATVTIEPQSPSVTGEAWIDVTSEFGLVEPLKGMHGHAAAWGDVDGSGELVDLVVGTFADRPEAVYRVRGADGASPDRLMLGGDEGFAFAAELGTGRTSGAVFADLDGDGDDDLVLSRNVKSPDAAGDYTMMFENVEGVLIPHPDSGLGAEIGGRSIGVFDENDDGLLDLFFVEDRYAGGSSRLFHNTGGLAFVDVTATRGLPEDIEGLGVASVDLDGDARQDLFVSGSNRLFAGSDDGFTEVDSSVFAWETFGDEDLVAGVATGDLDRDGRLDLVIGHHFNSTVDFGTRVPVRVYLNRSQEGSFEFIDVTDRVGMVGLPTKAPHVEVVDLDNDGWPDILTSASADGGAVPAVFAHEGMVDGLPRFSAPEGLGSSQYWVTAPTADVNGDLRVDVLAVEWEPSLPSILFLNGRKTGHAVRVQFEGASPIGSRVSVFDAFDGSLIGFQEVVASVGYTAGVESVAHFGIGARESVEIRVEMANGDVYRSSVNANSVVTIES